MRSPAGGTPDPAGAGSGASPRSPDPVEMVHRTMPGSHLQQVSGFKGFLQPGFGALQRVCPVTGPGEQGSQCGRERAAGAVGVLGVYPHGTERRDRESALAVGHYQRIRCRSSGQVPALHQHSRVILAGKAASLLQCLVPVLRRPFLQQGSQLRQVRRHQVHLVQQPAKGIFGIGAEQAVTAAGHHHRIQHHGRRPDVRQPGTHRPGNLGAAQHADFHRIDNHVIAHRVQLFAKEPGRRGMHGADPVSVLRNKCRDHSHAVSAVGSDRLQIRLDPGPARGIRSGDAQDPRDIPDAQPSHAATSSSALRRGSAAVQIAETTAAPDAPAARRSRMSDSPIPPIATHGTGAADAKDRNPSTPSGAG